jgi:hypothetical protein
MMRLSPAVRELLPLLIGAVFFCMFLSAIFTDQGTNLLSEAIGVAFTVFIVDAFIARRDKERLRPVLASAHRDALGMVTRCRQMLSYALIASVTADDLEMLGGGDHPISAFAPSLRRLTLDGKISVLQLSSAGRTSRRDLLTELKSFADELSRSCSRFAERYATLVDPELYALIAKLELSSLIRVAKSLGPNDQLSTGYWTDIADLADLIAKKLATLDPPPEWADIRLPS